MARFDRSEHVYSSPDFEEIVKDTIRFFNGTPVHVVPAPEKFSGTGVYAIYCTAKTGIYKKFHAVNRTAYNMPIYVGKAVPKGWRQGRLTAADDEVSYELHQRIKEHSRSIDLGEGLNLDDYRCRFMILEGKESDLIGTVEAALIRKYLPLWNTVVDGFGNHDPGSGRYEQAKSEWDVCHPGRMWAEKCKGKHKTHAALTMAIHGYLATLETENV